MCDIVAPLLVVIDDEVTVYSCFSLLMERMIQWEKHFTTILFITRWPSVISLLATRWTTTLLICEFWCRLDYFIFAQDILAETFIIARCWMKAFTTTSSRMETFLISIFVTAGRQKKHSLSHPHFIDMYCVLKVSPGLQERVQLSPSVQSVGDHLGSRQEIDLFSIYPGVLCFISQAKSLHHNFISSSLSAWWRHIEISLSIGETQEPGLCIH